MKLERSIWTLALCSLMSLGVVACEDEPETAQGNRSNARARASASAAVSANKAAGGAPPAPAVRYTEADFVESDDARDPFRNYAHLFIKKINDKGVLQRKVKASQFALDELRLVAIVTRGRRSVMLTDPNGFGWILYTGDFVGQPELVNAGGTDGSEVAINWRIDRIRPDSVVFIREDNAHPDIPPTTREMPLYAVSEGNRG